MENFKHFADRIVPSLQAKIQNLFNWARQKSHSHSLNLMLAKEVGLCAQNKNDNSKCQAPNGFRLFFPSATNLDIPCKLMSVNKHFTD